MKKITLVFSLCLCLGLWVSCKKQGDDVAPNFDSSIKFVKATIYRLNADNQRIDSSFFETNRIQHGFYGSADQKSWMFGYIETEDKHKSQLFFGLDSYQFRNGVKVYPGSPSNRFSPENPNAFFSFGKELGTYQYERDETNPQGFYKLNSVDNAYVYGTFAFKLRDKVRNKVIEVANGEFKIPIPIDGRPVDLQK